MPGLPPEIAAMMAQMGEGGMPGGGVPMPLPPQPTDEEMISNVTDQAGSGDMETDAAALVAMYEEGDPSDPAVLEQWRRAKDEFIAKYGAENLPDLPNDPDTGSQEDEY